MSHHHSNVRSPLVNFKPTKNGRKLFFSFFRRNPRLMTTALCLMIINIFLILLPAVLVGRSLDILVNEGYGRSFVLSVSLILVVAGLAYVTSAISNYAFSVTAFATERDVRNEFFDSIVNSSMQFHDRNNSSVLLSLGMNEVHFLAAGSMMLGIVLRSVISATMVMIYIYPLIGVVPLIITSNVFLIYFIYVYHYARRVVPVRRDASDTLASLTVQSQEIFRGIEVIRSMSSENKEIKRFDEINHLNAKYSEKEGKLRSFYIPGLVLLLIIGILFTVGVFQVINDFISVSQLVEIIGLLISLQTINFTIPNIVLAIRGGILNADRISGKISEADHLAANQDIGDKILDTIETIEFDDVTFAYPGQGVAVLKRVSFKVTKGQNIVLLGAPGSGKSSIMKLLLRFYQPQHGKIRINGIDLQEYNTQSLRSKISLVEQDVYLFGESIRENIGFADPEASEETVRTAARLACADRFINQLDNGYDTVIGERGVTLSGGQRQRLAIARAIMSHPQVLLLDDSTSALDAKTELEIFESLGTVSEGITTFTIAHRISIIQQADLILFMDKGAMIGKGQHKELYEQNQTYHWMYDLLPDDRNDRKLIEQRMEEN